VTSSPRSTGKPPISTSPTANWRTDEDLTKLRGWFDKVSIRDRLGAAGRDTAAKALADCAQSLAAFAGTVYAADTDAT